MVMDKGRLKLKIISLATSSLINRVAVPVDEMESHWLESRAPSVSAFSASIPVSAPRHLNHSRQHVCRQPTWSVCDDAETSHFRTCRRIWDVISSTNPCQGDRDGVVLWWSNRWTIDCAWVSFASVACFFDSRESGPWWTCIFPRVSSSYPMSSVSPLQSAQCSCRVASDRRTILLMVVAFFASTCRVACLILNSICVCVCVSLPLSQWERWKRCGTRQTAPRCTHSPHSRAHKTKNLRDAISRRERPMAVESWSLVWYTNYEVISTLFEFHRNQLTANWGARL